MQCVVVTFPLSVIVGFSFRVTALDFFDTFDIILLVPLYLDFENPNEKRLVHIRTIPKAAEPSLFTTKSINAPSFHSVKNEIDIQTSLLDKQSNVSSNS